MKKILTVLIAFIVGNAMFAQSAKYTELMAKAQKYEQEKKWIHALDAYYDAMVAEPTEIALPAYKAFKTLLNTISKGEPGYGKFDEFSIYDDWIKLLQEFETYWTNFCPFAFSFEKLERVSLDIKNQTADYEISCKKIESEKFKLIYDAVQKGSKTKKEGGISEWPNKSIYTIQNGDSIKTNVLYNGAALYQCYRYYEYWSTMSGAGKGIEAGNIVPAGSGKTYFQLIINDKDGKFLMKHEFSSSQVNQNGILSLHKIPKNLVSVFDSGNIDIVLAQDARLAYSIYTEDIDDIMWHQNNLNYHYNLPEAEIQKFLKLNLKELTLPVKLDISSMELNIVKELETFERETEEKRVAAERQNQLLRNYSDICSDFVSSVGGNSEDFNKISLTVDENGNHLFAVPISFLSEHGIDEEIIIRNFSGYSITVLLEVKVKEKTHSWKNCIVKTQSENLWTGQRKYYGEAHLEGIYDNDMSKEFKRTFGNDGKFSKQNHNIAIFTLRLDESLIIQKICKDGDDICFEINRKEY